MPPTLNIFCLRDTWNRLVHAFKNELPLTSTRETMKCRRNLEKKAEQVQRQVGNGNENAFFDALDEALSA
jgi:hypothetical protein